MKGASCRSSAPLQALLWGVRGQELLPGSSWSEADLIWGMERREHLCLARFIGGKKEKKMLHFIHFIFIDIYL